MYKFLYIILLLFLFIEVIKPFSNNICERFSNTPTDVILSNSPSRGENDTYIKSNSSTLLMVQRNNKREPIFNYVRAPLNTKFIVNITRKKETGDEEIVKTNQPLNITGINQEVNNLLETNRLLVSDPSSTLHYYVKFLNKEGYKEELKNIQTINSKKEAYETCMNNSIGLPQKEAVFKCRSIQGL